VSSLSSTPEKHCCPPGGYFQAEADRILVLGIGNVLMGDDGLGVHVVRELQKVSLPENVDIVDGGTKGIELVPYCENKKRLIIVDAIDLGREPGELIVLKGEHVRRYLGETRCSMHEVGVSDLLSVLALLDIQPGEVLLIGLQPEKIEVGMDLSKSLQDNLQGIVDTIKDMIHA